MREEPREPVNLTDGCSELYSTSSVPVAAARQTEGACIPS